MWEKPKNLNLIEGNKYSVLTTDKFIHQTEFIEGKFINFIHKTEVKNIDWIWR